jgi:hypothetical protein
MKLALTILVALLLSPLDALQAAGRPVLYWSAEPVMPGEAAMLQGVGFDTVTGIEVEFGDKRTAVPVLDANERSLRFVLPKDWSAGSVDCRIETKSGVLEHTLNAPQPWWLQADEGQTASPGGWVRVCGRCLLMTGEARMELRRAGQTLPLKVREAGMWSLEAELPAMTAAGDYELWTHNGCQWAAAGKLNVQSIPRPWMQREIVIDARADDEEDDSAALQKALDEAATQGGGVIRFPRGRFRLTGGFVLPPNVALRGEGMALTHLLWADTETPPEAFITSTTGRLAIEDLSLYASNYRCGLRVRADKGAPAAEDVRLRRVGARFTALSVKGLTGEALEARKTALAGAAVFEIFANNVQITDCDLAWTKNIGFSAQGSDIVCRGNRAQGAEGGWCPVGGGRRAIVERNDFNGVTTGITRGAEVFFAHNTVAHMYHGFREGFTTDGAFGGPGLLLDANVDGREIAHAGATHRTEPPHIPAVVRVIDGAGAGQWRMVERFEAGKIVMDRPFDVPVDAASQFYAANAMMRHILFDNQWSDTGIAAQLYGGALDCVMAGNQSARSGGFRVWGNETAWYVQMLGNQITEGLGTIGPEANAGSSMLHVVGPYLVRNNIRFTGTTARGIVMRRNVLHNNATITLRGAIHDVLLENNQIKHSPQGIIGDLWQRQSGVLLRGNALEDVTTEHVPADAGYRTVDP